VPQVTIPSIQINKSQGGPVKTPAIQSIQPRQDNRAPPPAISTTVPVIEVFSISNAPPVNVSSRNGYWVQLGSYSDANHAQRSWRAFSNTGMGSAEIFSTNVNGKTYYRVKAGPYSSKTDAEQALAKLKNYSPVYNDSFITNE
jgi:DedD protein